MSLKFKYVIALIERSVFAKKHAEILSGRMFGQKRVTFPNSFSYPHTYHMLPWAGIEPVLTFSHGLLAIRHKQRFMENFSCGTWLITLNIMKMNGESLAGNHRGKT